MVAWGWGSVKATVVAATLRVGRYAEEKFALSPQNCLTRQYFFVPFIKPTVPLGMGQHQLMQQKGFCDESFINGVP